MRDNTKKTGNLRMRRLSNTVAKENDVLRVRSSAPAVHIQQPSDHESHPLPVDDLGPLRQERMHLRISHSSLVQTATNLRFINKVHDADILLEFVQISKLR